MVLGDELRLSYYRQLGNIDGDHGVYLVQDIRDNKVRVKKVLPVYDLGVYQYLMAHPMDHIPKIFELVEDGDVLILIEEYIPGDTLQQILDTRGPLPEAEVMDIAIALCRILEQLHGCCPPIVNRDIKPSNIMLTGDGVVKLLDMNAAKRYDPRREKDTVLIGTQGYAAPEQYGFGASSVLTDVYSMGVLLRVLLTGRLTGGWIPNAKLHRILERCTQLDPRDRYQSVRALEEALVALRSGRKPEPAVGKRRYLPPGFRSRDPLVWIVATMGYLFLLMVCFSLDVEGAGWAETLCYRVMLALAAVAMVLFSGNYLGVQSYVVLTRAKNLLLRLPGIILVDFLILVAWVVSMAALGAAFFR